MNAEPSPKAVLSSQHLLLPSKPESATTLHHMLDCIHSYLVMGQNGHETRADLPGF